MSWWKNILGVFVGGVTRQGGTLEKAMDLIAERTEDVDKCDAAIVELYKLQLQAEQTPEWLPALAHWQGLTFGARVALSAMIWAHAAHKLGRLLMWCFIVYIAAGELAADRVTLQEFAALAAGPVLYTMLKGRGR